MGPNFICATLNGWPQLKLPKFGFCTYTTVLWLSIFFLPEFFTFSYNTMIVKVAYYSGCKVPSHKMLTVFFFFRHSFFGSTSYMVHDYVSATVYIIGYIVPHALHIDGQ